MRGSTWLAPVMIPILVATLAVPEAQAQVCWSYHRHERRLARKINRARARHSLGRVRVDPQLSKVSRVHTWDMIGRERVYHTRDATLARRVTNWRILGENVGSTTGGARHIFRAMMRSSLHRANILESAYNHVGVGTKRRKGRLWVTITFESLDNPGTRLRMPSC
jgi:uncharacterized protein YkwD